MNGYRLSMETKAERSKVVARIQEQQSESEFLVDDVQLDEKTLLKIISSKGIIKSFVLKL